MDEQVLAPVVSEPEPVIDPEQEEQNQQVQPLRRLKRRARLPRVIAIVAVVLLALLIIASATRAIIPSSMRTPYSTQEGDALPLASQAGGYTDMYAPEKAPAAVQDAATSNTVAGSAASSGAAATDWDRKIIRNGNISLQVADVQKSLADVSDIAKAAGGLVFSSDSQYQGDDMVSTLTIQVPVTTFDSVMTSLRRLGVKVLNESSTSQDVTEEFTDLSSQLKNLQASEDQLRAIMAQAKTVAETLAVQGQLSSVRGQIEQIQGRINYLSRRADLSSITISLSPKPLVFTTETTTQNAAERAWNASLTMLSTVGDALITVVVFFWWQIPLLIAGWLLRGKIFSRRERAMN